MGSIKNLIAAAVNFLLRMSFIKKYLTSCQMGEILRRKFAQKQAIPHFTQSRRKNDFRRNGLCSNLTSTFFKGKKFLDCCDWVFFIDFFLFPYLDEFFETFPVVNVPDFFA